MPWTTPSLADVRRLTRDNVAAALQGASVIGNGVLPKVADAMSALAHLVLRYVFWVSQQLLPDTAEREWLDRHANIWIGGRKDATYAAGTATFTGIDGTVLPAGTRLAAATGGVQYETTEQITIGSAATPAAIRALTPGSAGNQDSGASLNLSGAVAGVDATAVVVSLIGGVDIESDDSLRERVLFRIQRPPMGGDADDYVAWTRKISGVSRAWSYPNEMGIGTVTVRFMMDELRAGQSGIPQSGDIDAVRAYLDTVRPVAVKDFFVVAPILQPVNFTITSLSTDNAATRAAIAAAVKQMLIERCPPGQTVYRSWVDEAISGAIGEDHHELTFSSTAMQSPGHIPVLGTITYA
jgi:uncharacterized phage protein gp47/JayE